MTQPPSVCERIFAGETPLKAWADYRDIDPSDLRSPTITVRRIEQLMEGRGRKMSEAEERHFARMGAVVLFGGVCFMAGMILKHRPGNERRIWLCITLCGLCVVGELYAFMGVVIAPWVSVATG